LRRTPATVATIVALLEPAVAAILAWLLLGERLQPGAVGAMALLAGAILALQAG
ncbi:MAG: EamA family transporter, partial [Chloroflexota bacterium]|nr:EamA family transporter [Chloroflexota bacterium]